MMTEEGTAKNKMIGRLNGHLMVEEEIENRLIETIKGGGAEVGVIVRLAEGGGAEVLVREEVVGTLVNKGEAIMEMGGVNEDLKEEDQEVGVVKVSVEEEV